MRRFITLVSAVCLIGVAGAGLPVRAAEVEVDLELALAVDVSGSMDPDEQRIQRDGYVAALRHPEVVLAMTSGAFGRIALTYIEWAGIGIAVIGVPWTLIANRQDAEGFAARLAAAPISSEVGTSISSGLLVASGMFAANGFKGYRQAIDVSGDGPNNEGVPIDQVRDLLVRRGFTINGLPIMVTLVPDSYDIPYLDAYYQSCVIGGPGAFLVRVVDPGQFEAAIRRKLVLETSGLQPRFMLAALTNALPVDCQVGEKIRHRILFPNR